MLCGNLNYDFLYTGRDARRNKSLSGDKVDMQICKQ